MKILMSFLKTKMYALSSPTSCFSLIIITGRKEHIERFRNIMEGDIFHFEQTVHPRLGEKFDAERSWGTKALIFAKLIEDTREKVVILCETEMTPGLVWAERCEAIFREKRLPQNRFHVCIQTNYYSLGTRKYGIHIVKPAGRGKHEWDMPDFSKKIGKTHFDHFIEQFGFLHPKVQSVLNES